MNAYSGRDLDPDPSTVHVDSSAILHTRAGGSEPGSNDFQEFGDGLVAGQGAELHVNSVISLDNARAGAFYFEAKGALTDTLIAGNGSYGLAMESCHQYVDWSDTFIFGNVLEAVTTSPHGLPVPPPPEFDMEPLSPPR